MNQLSMVSRCLQASALALHFIMRCLIRLFLVPPMERNLVVAWRAILANNGCLPEL